MSQFNEEEIREEENINHEEESPTPPPKPPFKGRHINFKFIYIIAGAIVLYLIISVFRGPSVGKGKDNGSKKEVQKQR